MRIVLFLTAFILSSFTPGSLQQPKRQNFCKDNLVWLDSRLASGAGLTNPAMSNGVESVIIPLKRAGNLILMDALIDSLYGNLILDTGAEGIVLNSIYFRSKRRASSQMAGGITGTTGTVSQSKVGSLQISDLVFSNLDVNVSDLGHIESARNVKILGFFGLNLINNYEAVLDLRNNLLELHRTDQRGNRLNTASNLPRFDISIPATVSSDVLFIRGTINQRSLNFCIDTGAETNVLSSALPDRVLSTVSVFRRSTLKGAGSQNVEVVYGMMNDFAIGNNKISGMNSIITNLSAMGNFYKMPIDGMLGCDFFEKGVFYINIRKKNISIKLNKEG